MSLQRLQKIIAQSGLTSRREAETLIRQGRVKVNGKIAAIGDKASASDSIFVDDKRVDQRTAQVQVLLLNKPEGYITSRKDPQSRKSVFDLLPIIKTGRWISVGRLDINTAGLLLFTSDGEFANQLMHPSSNIEREYLCRVFGKVNINKINKLKEGVNLEYGKSKAYFKSITTVNDKGQNNWFKVVLNQGRYREVRRMWQAVGCQVNRLTRIRYGDLTLPANLPAGKYRLLSPAEIERLQESVS